MQKLKEKQDKEFKDIKSDIISRLGEDFGSSHIGRSSKSIESRINSRLSSEQTEELEEELEEVKNFLDKVRKETIEYERKRIIEIVKKVEKKNDSNGRYNACAEILEEL